MNAALSAAAASLATALAALPALAAIPTTPSFASNYRPVWIQDFASMTQLSQLNAVGGYSMGTGTWISHTPSAQDWCTFIDPVDNNDPFGVGNGYLTIRAAKRGYGDPNNWFGGYSSGLLCSMDSKGVGFAQQYGYFEVSMQTPGGANTWPAFWLLSENGTQQNTAELDVTESYGNWGTGPNQSPAGNPNYTTATWHQWLSSGGSNANGSSILVPGLTTGFHTYGVDIEPTGITWYVDRHAFWTSPIFPEAERPMYVLLDLALGGGNYNNANGTGYNWALTPDPSDLKVQYVAVWASPNSPNYVPEPSALGLLAVSAAGLLRRRRRRD